MLQSQLIDQLLHLLSALVPGDRLRFQHREDVLLDSKLAKHRCFLGEITDSVLACPQIHGHICYIFVVDEHSACIGGDQTHNRVESSSFASAVRSKQTNHFALLHARSEEHTSELQSPCNLVCRLLLEKKTPNN